MNDLTVFANEQFGEIRTALIDGEPWFVAADVCKALEIKDTWGATNRLDEDEKDTVLISTPGGTQEMTTINEPGLYSLVLGSRKPEAKAFKRWITHEVIPEIRRTGGYQLRPRTANEMFLMQAEINVENERKLAALEDRLDETERRISETTEIFRSRTLDNKDSWTKEMNRQVNEIVEGNRLNHQTYRKKLYTMLELQLGIDLERRRVNYQKRLKAGGAMYREFHDVSKLQTIAQDAKLRAAFELIVKQEAAAYAMSGRVR